MGICSVKDESKDWQMHGRCFRRKTLTRANGGAWLVLQSVVGINVIPGTSVDHESCTAVVR